MKNRLLSIVGQAALLAGLYTGIAAAAQHPYFNFIGPVDDSSVTGLVEIRLNASLPQASTAIVHVDYYIDGVNGKKVAQWSPGGLGDYYASFNASVVTAGQHTLSAIATFADRTTFSAIITLYVNASAGNNCPALQVEIRNLSSQFVGGAIDGSGAKNMGTSGYTVDASRTTTIPLFVEKGSSFPLRFVAGVQGPGTIPTQQTICTGSIRVANSCPATGAIALLWDSGNAMKPLACSLYTY